VDVATSYLTGPALAHWQAVAEPRPYSFEEFKTLLFQRFDLVDPAIHARRMLSELQQGSRSAVEHLRQFEFWSSLLPDQSEGEKVHSFLRSLHPKTQRECSINPVNQRQWTHFADVSRCFLSHALASSSAAAVLTEFHPEFVQQGNVSRHPSGDEDWQQVAPRRGRQQQQSSSYAAAARQPPRARSRSQSGAARPLPPPRQSGQARRAGATGVGNSSNTLREYRNAVGDRFCRTSAVRNTCFLPPGRCLCCFQGGHLYKDCKSRPMSSDAKPN
jgi:hypothetical protein